MLELVFHKRNKIFYTARFDLIKCIDMQSFQSAEGQNRLSFITKYLLTVKLIER